MKISTLLTTKGNIRANDMRELLMAFFPYGNILMGDELQAAERHLDVTEDGVKVEATYKDKQGCLLRREASISKDQNAHQIEKRLIYDLLSTVTGIQLKWGTMTGIRPVRVAHRKMMEKGETQEIKEKLKKEYRLSPQALEKMMNVAAKEVEMLYPLGKKKTQVYINIPFCPSRCSYCSFITQEAGTDEKLLKTYVAALKQEIMVMGNYLKEEHWEVESIYVGGGTSTVLEVETMEELLQCINSFLPMEALKEFTYEGGRPDTITKEKLACLRKFGVNRISVNPQTLHEKTLVKLGRNHDVDSFYAAVQLARETGFRTMNCDLILGLEGEKEAEMVKSAKALLALAPENITIHSLSLKHSSYLAAEKLGPNGTMDLDGSESAKAAAKIYDLFQEQGYMPYYLYRQKYCVNNGENIGFTKPGHEGFYNMAIMSDKRTVVGLGAGSTGKLYNPQRDEYGRMETSKSVKLYVENSISEGKKKVALLKTLMEITD